MKNPGERRTTTETAPYSTDFIADKAAAFVDAFEADDDQPWFMQVSPHAPHDIKPEGTTTSGCNLNDLYTWPDRHDDVAVPPWNADTGGRRSRGSTDGEGRQGSLPAEPAVPAGLPAVTHEGQMRTLLAADDMVDTVMQKLQATGELANTLVIFTTDNGYSWGERGVTSKGLPYTEHVKAPFLVRWDGVFPAGGDRRPPRRRRGLPPDLPSGGAVHAAGGALPARRPVVPAGPAGQGREAPRVRARRPPEPAARTRATTASPPGRRCGPPAGSTSSTTSADNTTVAVAGVLRPHPDPWELDNLVVTDPARDPDLADLSAELRRIRTCVGTTGPAACP